MPFRRYTLTIVLIVSSVSLGPAQASEHGIIAKLEAVARKNISDNHSQFSDGTDFFRAAPRYPDVYISDLGLTMIGLPDLFSSEQIENIIEKFMSSTSASGWIPMALKKDGGVFVYCSAWDRRCDHPTGDGVFFLSLLEELYWRKSGSTARFIRDSKKLKVALDIVPRDPVTGCVEVVSGHEWVPWAFEEESRKTGIDAIGCVMYWRAASALGNLYGQAGSVENSRHFLGQAETIRLSLQSSNSPIWDSVDGMFYAASEQNRQIDILASSLAIHYGLASAAQRAAMTAWLTKNYSSITYRGYVLQSPVSWQVVGYIPAVKGAPYDPSPYAAESYQSAFWSVGNQWVSEALYLSSPNLAAMLTKDFASNADPTMEYYAPHGNPRHGYEQNLESPVGSTAFAMAHPKLF